MVQRWLPEKNRVYGLVGTECRDIQSKQEGDEGVPESLMEALSKTAQSLRWTSQL
jgi:hypothetical protein